MLLSEISGEFLEEAREKKNVLQQDKRIFLSVDIVSFGGEKVGLLQAKEKGWSFHSVETFYHRNYSIKLKAYLNMSWR